MLRIRYGFATVKPRSHYGVDGMLRLCNGNGSATVSTEREALDRLCVRLNMYLVKHNHHHHRRVLRFYMVWCCIYFASDQYIAAMLHTSIGIGIGYWYR